MLLQRDKVSFLPIFFRESLSYRRRLLRFSVKVENRGLDHFRPFADKSTWEWHSCHKHYHSMETFSSYDFIREYKINVKYFKNCHKAVNAKQKLSEMQMNQRQKTSQPVGQTGRRMNTQISKQIKC